MKPNKLKAGQYIGVISPSGNLADKDVTLIEESIKRANELGLAVKLGKHIYSDSTGYGPSQKEKIDDLHNMFMDPSVGIIMASRGGSNSNSILEDIDYALIKNNPKIFIGLSDITALLNAITSMTDLITFHFGGFKVFLKEEYEYNKYQFIHAFFKGNKGIVSKNKNWTTVRRGVAEGKLYGGNLQTFIKILNTKFCPELQNSILFIEDDYGSCNTKELHSFLHILKQNGIFDKISGLLLGHYASNSIPLEKIVLDVVKDYSFPIIKCDDFGHTPSNMVIPIGCMARLDADSCNLEILEDMTE